MYETRGIRARLGRSQRGAAIIEALFVCSIFILGLLGMVYFRGLYLKKLGAQRMARAAVIAHSMVGCKDNQPRAWLARDGNGYRVLGAPPTRTPAINAKTNESYANSDTSSNSLAPGLLGKLGKSSGTTSDGKGMLNPITDAHLAGDVEVSNRSGVLSKDGTSFRGEVGSQSFVSCGDEVKRGDYGSIIEMIKDELQSLNNAK